MDNAIVIASLGKLQPITAELFLMDCSRIRYSSLELQALGLHFVHIAS